MRARKLIRKARIRLDTEERRAQLLALARKQFSEHAYDEVSVDDLAREADISKGLLYHYFPTKRDLYVTSLRAIAGELVAACTAVPNELPPIEQIRMGLLAYLDHIEAHGRAFVSLMRGGIGSDPEVSSVIDGVRAQLFDSFLSSTPFAPLLRGNARFETAVKGWIGFVEAASLDWCLKPRMSKLELRDLLAEVIFEIMRAVAPKIFATK